MGRKQWLALVFGWLWLLVLVDPAWGQEAKLRIAQGPYYTDVAVDLEVVAQGFEESPEPKVQVEEPSGGRLELVGVSPEVSSSIQIINGQMSQWKSVRFVFHYRFTMDQKGAVTLGPFHVVQGGATAQTQSVTLEFGEIPAGGDQRILLILPDEPVFVGQRIPLRLQWWIQTDLVERLVGHEVRVPLFEMGDQFGFEEVDRGGQNNAMVIQSAAGAKKYAAETTQEVWDGRSWVVLTIDRIVIPLKGGDFDIPAASVILEEGVRWQRSFFGERSATQVRRLRATDTPKVLHVKPLPTQGQPDSFAGAIGQGFTLEVSAGRSVVQVGDPIVLTVTLRGDGSLATASLPRWVGGEGGLSEKDFRVPEGNLAGLVADGAKKFEVMVRVLHEGVKEIPPLAYSWFDPRKGAYETTTSRPIALSVGAAKMVSAGDVVRSQEAAVDEEKSEADQPPKPPTSGGSEQNDPGAKGLESSLLVGADLAVERDVDVLLGSGRGGWWLAVVAWGCYGGGLGLLAYGGWWWRRSRLDPEVDFRRRQLRALVVGVERAQTPHELADGLRRMAAVAVDVPRGELDRLLEILDNLAYAPQGGGGSVAEDLKSRSVAMARRLEGGNVS
ncbi:MAG: BatD family protein [Magnetococcus sp. THC-1_WYH]